MRTHFIVRRSSADKLRRLHLLAGSLEDLRRGIKNCLLDELNQKDVEILPYPLQRALVRHLSIPAEKAGRPEFFLWAGQSASLSRCTEVRALPRHARKRNF